MSNSQDTIDVNHSIRQCNLHMDEYSPLRIHPARPRQFFHIVFHRTYLYEATLLDELDQIQRADLSTQRELFVSILQSRVNLTLLTSLAYEETSRFLI